MLLDLLVVISVWLQMSMEIYTLAWEIRDVAIFGGFWIIY